MIRKKGITIGETDLRKILSNYDIGSLKSYSDMPEGVENINAQVRTDKGLFTVKLFLQEYTTEVNSLFYEFNLLEYLAEKGLRTPNLVRTAAGNPCVKYKGHFCAIYTFIEGSTKYPINSDTVGQIAAFVGRFHKTIQGYSKLRTYRGKFTPRTLRSTLIKEVLPSYKNPIKSKVIEETKFIWRMKYDDLPKGEIHMDIAPVNFVFKDGKLQGAIDFGDSLYGLLIIDVARGIYELCMESGVKIDRELIQIFLKNYEKYRPLTRKERAALVDFIRFTYIWKLTDGIIKRRQVSWLQKRLDTLKKVRRGALSMSSC